jgi:3'-phosphoadenosine 5'-phosphosulfate sulfotransferase (PAPS reductase)/FAD synthetase
VPSTPAASRRPADPPTPETPDLAGYDAIIVNSSAGKDSQAALDVVAHAADQARVLHRVVVLHADLGDVEWPGVPQLAAVQAAHYGLRLAIRRREQNGLLDLIRGRGRWPSSLARYCTSATKRQPARRFMTEHVRALGLHRPARILNVLGLRAEESHHRAQQSPLARDAGASNLTRRHVDTWLPIHTLTTGQVWQRIRASAVPHHSAYDHGMRRLSCSICPLAARADIVRACQLRPDLARTYRDLEDTLGVPLRPRLSIRDAYAEAAATAAPNDPITGGRPLPTARWSW